MKLALECPTDMLEMVQPFADFDWILVDKYKSDPTYANFYQQSERIKFVDNSVTELGEPCSMTDLRAVFEDCNGTYIVSPDWINDYKQTIDAYKESIENFPVERVVGVLQGETPEKALKCLNTYQNKIVLVPYRVGGSVKGDPNWLMALRRQLIVSHIPNEYFIHLLGYTSSTEFAWYVNRPNVESIDTDVPIRAGLLNQDIDEFDRTDTTKVKLNKENWASVCRNIALLRKYIG